MAVEIRELVIKAIITKDEEPGENASSEPATEQIIQQCVSQVLKIIKQSQNR